jgi:dienelactone hydrolase
MRDYTTKTGYTGVHTVSNADPSRRSLRQRLRFVIRSVALATAALLLMLPFAAGFTFMAFVTRPGCTGGANPAAYGMMFEDVSFPSSEFGQPTPAFFIPAANPNGATVIVAPTLAAGRGDRIHEIAVYHRNGYRVLTYDSRACLANVSASLGYREAPQVGDALNYLHTRADVDMKRIAVHGFSAGGAAAMMAAARFPELRAVVAEGGYHNFTRQLEQDSAGIGVLGGLFRLGAHVGYRITTGDEIGVLSPIDAIAEIAPRPILLVYGTNEPSLQGARLMQAAATNATLWEVPGATHGSYVFTAPDEYERIVIGFMDGAMGVD